MKPAALLLFSVYCVAQTSSTSPSLTFAELSKAARAYLRDSAEFPLKMHLTMAATNLAGRTIRRDTAEGQLDFHGYNPHDARAAASIHVRTKGMFHSPKGMLATALNSFIGSTVPPTDALFKDASEKFSFEEIAGSADDQYISARISPAKCTEFKWSSRNTTPETFCGSTQFRLQKGNLILKHFSFDASALPIDTEVKPFGSCRLLRYHVEAEFQQVTLANDPNPFLVPQSAEITIETDKGKLVMTSQFEPGN